MKKIVALLVLAAFSLAANPQVFSQKNRTVWNNKVPSEKTETPIIKNESPVGVKLQSAEAFSDGGGVLLRWRTEFEKRNLGFLVYRVGTEQIEPAFVPGGSAKSSEQIVYGENYTYFDAQGSQTTVYQIESIGTDGSRQIVGQISPKYVADLASVADDFSSELPRNQKSKSPTGESVLEIPKELASEIEQNTLPPDINTQRLVAAEPGVKIGVKQGGIYRVSRAELQAAGFDVNAPGNLWQLYADGNQQAIIVGANDSYIEFYGKGIDTPESDTKVYYLIVGAQNGLRMNQSSVRPLSGPVVGRSYSQTFVRKDRNIYLSSDILNGDAENFFGNVPIVGSSGTPNPATTTFTLTGIDFNIPKAAFTLSIQGITATPHQIVPTLNGNQLDPFPGNGFNLMTQTYQIPTSFLVEGVNTLQLRTFGGAGDFNLIESIRIGYQRKYEAMQNRLAFYTSNYRKTTISGFTSPNIRVFDLTSPDKPILLTNLVIENNGGNHSVTLPANRGRAAFAAEDSALLSASSITANTPSTLSTTTHNAELLIVSYKDWMTQAENWANYRRGQGMTVEVVNIEDIQDEFSYGSVDTSGIRQFFQYAKNNWQTPPKYILLIGDTSYDFRNYENRPFQNFVPTKRVDTVYEETGSDEALADFNNIGLAEIAIGRIPARSAADVTQALNKTIVFESNLATAQNRGAVCASDLPVGYDFEGLCQRVFTPLPPGIPKTFIHRGQPDSSNLLISGLNQGPYILNYSGHGSTGSWQSNWLTVTDANVLTNSPNYSLYFMLTCLNGYFLRTDFDSLGEALLKAPNGGGAAVWASTGKTTPDVQEILATRFYSQLNVGTMTRIGDLIKDAKQNLNGGRDVRLSWALLGDPTLKIKP